MCVYRKCVYVSAACACVVDVCVFSVWDRDMMRLGVGVVLDGRTGKLDKNLL